ncbi:MAG: hypothetical protein N4J56_006136 [Chroococcidiopsis sp. SAG 2025]|nr:hypothetical protein [Chroococcidiopsis sp. SAG 2025]
MNLQLHRVISDITGTTGMAIIRAIVTGERNPDVLASHKDGRVKASCAEIAAALTGDYRPEMVFILQQELQLYDFFKYRSLPVMPKLSNAWHLLDLKLM